MLVEITYPKPKEHRKVKIKVIDHDLWFGCTNTAVIILAILKKYRKHFNKKNAVKGYPCEFSAHFNAMTAEQTPEEHNIAWEKFDNESPEECNAREDKELKQWLDCIDKMIYSFDHIAHDRDFPWEKEMHKEMDKAIKDANLNIDFIDSLSDPEAQRIRNEIYEKYNYIKRLKESEQQVQDGLDLFAKHFRSIGT